MNGRLLIGGGTFTHEQMDFGHLVTTNSIYNLCKLEMSHLREGISVIDEDFVVILGLRGIVRILRKEGLRPRQAREVMKEFFGRTIPKNIPLIILDDFSSLDVKMYHDFFLKYFCQTFNLRLYLLREYLKNKQYPDWVVPFSLPSNSYSSLRLNNNVKRCEFFFHGSASHKDRIRITRKLQRTYPNESNHLIITFGGVKNIADRIQRDDFLELMAQSRLCLSFSGTSHDCYRYQEIASVGSVIVSPDYPLLIRNDYVDLESCIKYRNFREFKIKYAKIKASADFLDELLGRSVEKFERFHTSEKRADEFMEYVSDAIRSNTSANKSEH